MLNLIAGSLPLTSGEREIGETTAVGFFQQEAAHQPAPGHVYG